MPPSLFLAGVQNLHGLCEAAVGADVLLVCFLGIHALLDGVHHLAKVYELVADDLVVLINADAQNISPVLPPAAPPSPLL